VKNLPPRHKNAHFHGLDRRRQGFVYPCAMIEYVNAKNQYQA
jgi:hypothetical protein